MSEEINESRRKLLGATALGFVAAQLGAAPPAFAQNNDPGRGTTSTGSFGRLRPHYDEAGLLHKDLTLDEFEGELTVSNQKKRITVRLEAETAARSQFDRWLSEIRRRHPSRLQSKELRNKRVTREDRH